MYHILSLFLFEGYSVIISRKISTQKQCSAQKKTQQEFEEICLQFEKKFLKKRIPSAYSASIFQDFLKAEEKYPNLNKALEVLTNEDYFQNSSETLV